MTLPPLPEIAAKLAEALRLHQCGKTTYGQWPAFKVGGKFKEVRCRSCEALAEYDALVKGIQSQAK